MAVGINYKQKYDELKLKFMDSVDQAFRLGFEQGMEKGQQAAQQAAQQPQVDANGNPIANEQGNPQDPSAGGEGQGSELDQYISKLESMIGNQDAKPEEIAKALEGIKSFRKSQLQEIELKKSARAIPEIAKALHTPKYKENIQISQNLGNNTKQSLSMQEKIVSDIMNKWEEQETKVAKEIKQVIGVEGLLKKE